MVIRKGCTIIAHPSRSQHGGAAIAALQALCRDASKQRNLHVTFTHRSIPSSVDPHVSLCLYRIAQEALHNVARHSQTREAHVSVACNADHIALQIADSGVGFNPSDRRSAGLGLASMRERVAVLKGQLAINAAPGAGTQIAVQIPLVDVKAQYAPLLEELKKRMAEVLDSGSFILGPEVKALEDVYLYTVDDLASVVQTGHANRQAAVAQAEAIIDAGVQSFVHWLDQRHAVPLIQQLNSQADEWRDAELARARRMLARGEDIDTVLEALSRGLTQKMLHGAMAELRAGDAEARQRASTAIEHFFLRKER